MEKRHLWTTLGRTQETRDDQQVAEKDIAGKKKDYLSFILLTAACCLFFGTAGSLKDSRNAAWESRAKGTLRSIGSCELAYQSANDEHHYGSFQAMLDTEYVAGGYSLGNMIENYSLSWDAYNPSTVTDEIRPVYTMSTFTVVAWPLVMRNGHLHTFGITEDQVVRVYNPKNENRLDIVRSWDPIM